MTDIPQTFDEREGLARAAEDVSAMLALARDLLRIGTSDDELRTSITEDEIGRLDSIIRFAFHRTPPAAAATNQIRGQIRG